MSSSCASTSRRHIPPELLALQDSFVAAALVDEGERAEDIPIRRRSLVEYRGVLHRQIIQLDRPTS